MALFIVFLLFLSACSSCEGKGIEEMSGMFVFGSSLVDNGNNNFLRNTSAKADYLPYGIDFLLGPSGRFTNGRNTIDILGELLNHPHFIPPFQDPKTRGKTILHGVNYASGGSGILDQTGSLAGNVISLNHQIKNFKEVTLPDLSALLGHTKRLSSHLSKSLFVVGTGGNDYLLNYFTPNVMSRITLKDFTHNLLATLSQQLKELYSLGGRKFVLLGVQPLGCVPVVRANRVANGRCVEAINDAALLFNANIRSLVDQIKPQMPGSNLVFVNTYKITREIIDDPISKGFKETSKPCCQVSPRSAGGDGILCIKGGHTCSERNTHIFFDGLHPTQILNEQIAKKAYSSNLQIHAYPFNIQQLVRL